LVGSIGEDAMSTMMSEGELMNANAEDVEQDDESDVKDSEGTDNAIASSSEDRDCDCDEDWAFDRS
jgi:hypothetical protein